MEPSPPPAPPPASRARGAVLVGGALALALAGASVAARAGTGVIALAWTGEDPGWTPGFAGHPPGVDRDWRFIAGLRDVPLPLEGGARALFIAADNPGGALVMYWKRPVTGLEPGATYAAAISVTFASDAPGGCETAAGAPGEDVALVAGVAPDEPAVVHAPDGWVHASFALAALGPIATRGGGCLERRFERRTLDTGAPLTLRAAADGTAWLVVGSASAYRGRTLLYVERVGLRLRRLDAGASRTAAR
jgi:hypothetical protein